MTFWTLVLGRSLAQSLASSLAFVAGCVQGSQVSRHAKRPAQPSIQARLLGHSQRELAFQG
jgi:hypothetical protein